MTGLRSTDLPTQRRVRLARPEPWLLGAFLVLFGVAISAAMPQISAAVRIGLADAAKTSPNSEHADRRASVRIRLLIVRAVEPAFAGGHDSSFVPVAAAFSVFVAKLVSATAIDLSQRIAERGFSARAPPSSNA